MIKGLLTSLWMGLLRVVMATYPGAAKLPTAGISESTFCATCDPAPRSGKTTDGIQSSCTTFFLVSLGYQTSDATTQTSLVFDTGLDNVCGTNVILQATHGAQQDESKDTKDYKSNEDCSYKIIPPAGYETQPVTMNFVRCDTERTYDFITVYDGTDTSGPQLGVLHGFACGRAFRVSSGNIFVMWTSDFSVTYTGWEFTWVYDGTALPFVVQSVFLGTNNVGVGLKTFELYACYDDHSCSSATDLIYSGTKSQLGMAWYVELDSYDWLYDAPLEEFDNANGEAGFFSRYVKLEMIDSWSGADINECILLDCGVLCTQWYSCNGMWLNEVEFWGVPAPTFDCEIETKTLAYNQVCDGINDCTDVYSFVDSGSIPREYTTHSDECNCGSSFSCLSDGHCIDASLVCDGLEHCADGSDEAICGGISVLPATNSLDKGGSTTYDISLAGPVPIDVLTVTPFMETSTGASASYWFTFTPTEVTFSASDLSPKTITVDAILDYKFEGDIIYSLFHDMSAPGDAAYDGKEDGPRLVQLFDVATPGITFVNSSTFEVSEGPISTHTFNFTLNSQPSAPVNLSFSDSAGSLVFNPSYIIFNGANWNTYLTVEMYGIDDSIYTGDTPTLVSTSVSSADSFYQVLSVSDVIGTVIENDIYGLTAVWISPSTPVFTTTVSEGDADIKFSLFLESEPQDDVVITLSAVGNPVTTILPFNMYITNGAQMDGSGDLIVTFTPADYSVPKVINFEFPHDFIDFPDVDITITAVVTSLDTFYNSLTPYPGEIPIDDFVITVQDIDTMGISNSASNNELSIVTRPGDVQFEFFIGSKPEADLNLTFTSTDLPNLTVAPGFIIVTPSNWNTTSHILTASLSAGGAGNYSITTGISSSDAAYNALSLPSLYVSVGCFPETTCSDRGTCTGSPCDCNLGFTSFGHQNLYCDICDTDYYGFPNCALCIRAATCSDHGDCAAGGGCDCDLGWDGAACDQCAPDYYGPACDPCPSDASGVCGGADPYTALPIGTCFDGLTGNGTCSCEVGYEGPICKNATITAVSQTSLSPNGLETLVISGNFLTFDNEYPLFNLKVWIRDSTNITSKVECIQTIAPSASEITCKTSPFLSLVSADAHIFIEIVGEPNAVSNTFPVTYVCGPGELDFPHCRYCDAATCNYNGACNATTNECICGVTFSGEYCDSCSNANLDYGAGCIMTSAPKIYGFTVYEADTSGGDLVEIYGELLGGTEAEVNLCGGREIWFSPDASNLTLNHLVCSDILVQTQNRHVTCRTPAGAGIHAISIAWCGSNREKASTAFSYDHPAVFAWIPVESFNDIPGFVTNRTETDGYDIIIQGKNFGRAEDNPIAFVDGIPCDITYHITHTKLYCRVNWNNIGINKEISVEVASLRSCEQLGEVCATYDYPIPVITSLSNFTNLHTNGGDLITIYGVYFGPAGSNVIAYLDTAVGRRQCSQTTWVANDTVTCVTPPGGGTDFGVRVFVSGQESITFRPPGQMLNFDIPVISEIWNEISNATSDTSLTSVGTEGSVDITLAGENFGNSDMGVPMVIIGDTECVKPHYDTVVQSTTPVIVCTVPSGVGTEHAVTVEVVGLVSLPAENHTISYSPSTITSVEPADLYANLANQKLTVFGTNFGEDSQEILITIETIKEGTLECTSVSFVTKHTAVTCDIPLLEQAVEGILVIEVGAQPGAPGSLVFKWQNLPKGFWAWVSIFIALCSIIVFGLIGFIWYHRTNRVMKAGSVPFQITMCVGGLLCMWSVLFADADTEPLCHFNTSFLSIGFILLYGALVVKNWRVLLIFNDALRPVKIPDQELFTYLGGMAGVDLILLIIFSALRTGCRLKEDWEWRFFAVLVTLHLVLLLSGVYVALAAKKITLNLFNDRVSIGYAISVIFLCSFFLVLIAILFRTEIQEVTGVQAMGVPITVLATLFFLFQSKVSKILWPTEADKEYQERKDSFGGAGLRRQTRAGSSAMSIQAQGSTDFDTELDTEINYDALSSKVDESELTESGLEMVPADEEEDSFGEDL